MCCVSRMMGDGRPRAGCQDRAICSTFVLSMDRTFTYTIGDLAFDEGLALKCDCRVRTYARRELVTQVGHDTRLHLVGLRRELWCRACGEPPFTGWVVSTIPIRP